MPHVPGLAFGFGALVGEYDLVARAAPGLQRLRVVAAAVEPAVPPEVYQVDEQLPADAADEAGWMPEGGRASPARGDRHFTGGDGPAALPASGPVRPLELARVAPAQRLAFPLRGEHPQLPLLLLGQAAAVPSLVVVRR